MKRLKLYLDTTVWNFAFADDAPQYTEATLEFFKLVRWGRFDIYTSETVLVEVEDAPDKRRRQIAALMGEVRPQRLELHGEVERLAKEYLKKEALPKRSLYDAYHVAYATFHGMDAVLSWNFKHLANINRHRRIVGINAQEGYNKDLQIMTPLEVIGHE